MTTAQVVKLKRVTRVTFGSVFLVVVLALFMLPFFWMVSGSLKTLREVSTFPPPILPAEPQWENYATAFSRAPLLRYGLNTLIVCVSVITLTIIMAVLAAYALVFLKFRGKEKVFLLLLAPQTIAQVILLLPLFVILRAFHLLNNLLALIIPYTVLYSPFSIMMLRGYMETIPKELIEAARIDGASEVWTMVRVVFPLVRPALATVALFSFIWSWNEFLFSLVLVQRPDMRTITVGLALLQSVPNFPTQFNIILAAATAVSLPVIILFFFTQRQFIQGITAGSVK